jgi:hypothetical protein
MSIVMLVLVKLIARYNLGMPHHSLVYILIVQAAFFAVGTYLTRSEIQRRKIIGRALQVISVFVIVLHLARFGWH